VGGCDIVTEMYESGELAEVLGVEPAEAPAPARAHTAEGGGSEPVQAAPLGIENRLG
jgi:monothiol glutaredoxin